MIGEKIDVVVEQLKYWFRLVIWRIIHLVFNCFLAIVYWDKKQVVPPIKNPLLFKSANHLAEEIRKGKLRSEDVVLAYIDRIQEVEPYINAVVEDRFEEALKDARKVDELITSNKCTEQQLKKDTPLLGVPFTVKILLSVKGFQLTGGSKLFKDQVASEDSQAVVLLKKAGGIVLATTNTPEFGLAYETDNLLYGRSCNPYDTTKTPGGSSGGEAALLGAGGSVIGLGNDLNGSLRFPAHFTGIFSHKATAGLISNDGSFPMPPKELEFLLHAGPMCRYPDDLVTLTRLLCSGKENLVNFDRKVDFKKLKVYYLTGINEPMSLPVDPDIVKGIQKAALYFAQKYGAAAQEIKISLLEHSNYMTIHFLVGSLENGVKFLTQGKIEDLNVLAEFSKFFTGNPTLSLLPMVLLGMARNPLFFNEKDIPFYRKVRDQLAEEFDKLLDENTILLYPTFPTTAFYHYEYLSMATNTCYVNSLNYLNLAITNCPIGINGNGMPQGMQIIGRRYNDPLTLACAVELSKVFGGWIPPDQAKKLG